MSDSNSIVKSFRTTEEQFNKANAILQREGFSVSEAIRILFDAVIREDRLPRGLSTKEMEPVLDMAKRRDDYVNDVLSMAGLSGKKTPTAEEKVLKLIFGDEGSDSNHMSNDSLREWGAKWGLPDKLSVATLADLYDSGLFIGDPWFGDYNAEIEPVCGTDGTKINTDLQDALLILECKDNITDNLDNVRKKLHVNAVKYLMESNNAREDESDDGDNDEE